MAIHTSPADPVEPDFPGIFESPAPNASSFKGNEKSAGRRRVLADWITSDENRLTARVMANRVWQFPLWDEASYEAATTLEN